MGYNFRLGYTEGFNQALTGKANEYKLPEHAWHSGERLSLLIDRPPESPGDENWCHAGGEEPEHYKTGYNWGYKDGREEREKAGAAIPAGDFERCMEAFAGSIKILYTQINKERYLVGVLEANPEEEKSSRHRFIQEFVSAGNLKPDKNVLHEIDFLLSGNNIQRAIDLSLSYFRDLKSIAGFCFALTVRSKLMYLREDSKKGRIEKAGYLAEKAELENSLMKFIKEKLEQ